jgi:Tfx family DNA-binding protein
MIYMSAAVEPGDADDKGVKEEQGGLLTDAQLRVLRLRLEGLTRKDVAERLGTTRQNISLIERRAHGNIEKAQQTLRAYRRLHTAATVELRPATHLVDVPRMLIDAADGAGVKIRVDFSLVYKELHRVAGGSIAGTKVIRPITLHVLRDGDVQVEPT